MKTYQCLGGFGLALMAAKLAESRIVQQIGDMGWFGCVSLREMRDGEYGCLPQTRNFCVERPDLNPVSCEYYRIIDRLTRGEAP